MTRQLDRRRRVIEVLMSGVSIGEVRDKFGACIECMRQPDNGHARGCPLSTPISDNDVIRKAT